MTTLLPIPEVSPIVRESRRRVGEPRKEGVMIYRSPYPDVLIPRVPLTPFVLEHALDRGANVALVDGPSGRSVSFAELDDAVRRCARGLQQRGLEPRQVVAIYSPNLPEYVIAFHGVSLAGGTATTANALYTADELRFQLQDSGARMLICAPPLLDAARTAAAGTAVEDIFVFGHDVSANSFASLLANDGEVAPVEIDVDEHVVTLPYSSGTTGFPKGVMLTHANLVANLCQCQPAFDVGEDDVVIGVLPFFHCYGQTVIMNQTLRHGVKIVTMPRFDLEQFLRLMQDYRVTACYVAPPIVLALAKHPLVDRFDLSSLRYVNSGAAPLDASLSKAASERLGCRVIQGYGLTETSPVTHAVGTVFANRPGSVGPSIPNTETRLVDPATGTDAAPGEPGEVWIRGPQVMRGYLNNEEATRSTVDEGGWLHSGDIGVCDEDGWLTIVDRLKELIKVKGYQVAPAELEALLLTHPAVADACVIGVTDPECGEVPKGFVVLREGASATADELIEHVRMHVSPHKRIRAIEFIDAIPKSASGKILRRILIEREREPMRN
jgi:acyl-CoA synthetase (AMP-forming)/AMP-acid ligase II